ncbi:non-reducing end alpha-L-arabinofuranosidase family hydrolase [Candidatus Latescibacterota bacterium]
MKKIIILLITAIVLLSGGTFLASAQTSQPFATPLKWISSDILVKPISDDTHSIVSIKDPTVVHYNGLWHIYATAFSTSAKTWSMVYLNFKEWSDAPNAKLTYIDVNPDLSGYHCAPHLFYFTPHEKWYLVFQSQQPQYCTTDDISKPETWTAPQDFFPSKPSTLGRKQWIDYHLISDDTHVYLFFTGDDGRFWRSRTKIEDFPNGMSDPEIAIKENRNALFEGSITYKIKGTNTYMTLIEALSPARYYRAWISNRLDGEWTPVEDATTWDIPFAGINNVTFEDGVTPWTRDISHGELLRDGYDEKMILDPENLRFLFQGRDPESGGNYSLLPYRLGLLTAVTPSSTDDAKAARPASEQAAEMFPLSSVRLLDGYFSDAVAANHTYLTAFDPDRLLFPFLREAGLPSKAESYGNWENIGLDGHTAGHYLSALADMIASDNDSDGEFNRRLDYMLDELERCQNTNGNGYIGGIPKSRELWDKIESGDIKAIWDRWAPWYNIHKTFAGLRDAYQIAGKEKALDLLIPLGDWCVNFASSLSDEQMQKMLDHEYGGMNEVMADIYAITGDEKYLTTAKRFNHHAVFDRYILHEDSLTGLHANTQIPKVTGLERIAALTGNADEHSGAEFFWDTVTQNRTVAFGGNSVSEHFNPTNDFIGMLEHREGPETCNTYNMLRLTRQLFSAEPKAIYADFYERALYNHILASINIDKPGYVYFTPIRPDHYRVYSQPEVSFWCCVGTGMENPGKYGEFIYARDNDGIYVNLFIPSELTVSDGFVLRQETRFPYESSSRLELKLEKPSTFTLRLRHPAWVPAGSFAIKINGNPVKVDSRPSSYAMIRQEWKDGDIVEMALPMHTRIERLPDGSDWAAILHGPILLAKPAGTENMDGLFADDGRWGQKANGPLVPLDSVPALLTTQEELPQHVVPDPSAGPLNFRIMDVIEPNESKGLPLVPFFSLHESRYQLYWELKSPE